MRSMRFIQWEMLMPMSRKPISEVVLEITDITSRPVMAGKQQADSYALKVKAAMTRLSESKRYPARTISPTGPRKCAAR